MKMNCTGRHKCGHIECYHHASNHDIDDTCNGSIYCPEAKMKVMCEATTNKCGTRRARKRATK